MRTRFCAMIRRPACSIMALTAPVRLRATASGLMIEKVRSIAMSGVPSEGLRAARQTTRGGGRLIAVDPLSGKVRARRDGDWPAALDPLDCAFSHTSGDFSPV